MAGRLSKYFRNNSGIILIFVVLLSILSLIFIYFDDFDGVTYETFPQIHSSDRIIIFSPHPDDESLANSGLIKEALKANATVLVVMMTNGDATPINISDYSIKNNISNFKGNIGDYRHIETINALKNLGLNESNIIFLSYPDGALKYLFGSNWDYNNPYKGADNSSNPYDHSTYNFSYETNAPYCGANVEKNIQQIITDFKPNIVLYPDDGDEHPDHAATSAFVIYTLIKSNYTGSTFTYLVHKGSWPSPLNYKPKSDLEAPRDVLNLDGTWYMLNLTDEDENSKEQAISSHVTQISLMENYLMSFVRVDEIFANYPIIDVEKVSNTNFTNGLPSSSSYEDLRYDSQTTLLLPSTDLAGAGLVYDDKYAYLLLKTSGDINSMIIYDYHLRIYNGTEFKRLDVSVVNGTANYELKASNSINARGNIAADVQRNIMVVKVPIKLFKGAKLIMMSADIKDADRNKLDDMSWRVFKFPTDFLSTIKELL